MTISTCTAVRIGKSASGIGSTPTVVQTAAQVATIPGAADVHIHQVVDYPEIDIDVNRSKAGQVGLTQRDVSTSLLISLSSSGQIAPTQWLDWSNGVSYFVAVQTPQYRLDNITDIMQTPIAPNSIFSSSTPTSLAGTANSTPGNIGGGPSQSTLAYGNPGAAINGNGTGVTDPGQALSASNFGTITAANPPRILQLSLKMDF